MYAYCPIFWASRLQTKIALRAAEAEYIALYPEFVCSVYEDNQYCTKMANSTKFTRRTKHIALIYHHFKSFVKSGKIHISYRRTEDQKLPKS